MTCFIGVSRKIACRRRLLSQWVLSAMMVLLVGARARVGNRMLRHRRQTALLATSSSSPPSSLKVCVVGAGYAGLACAYHFKQLAARDRRPLELTIYGREATIGDIAVSSASAVSAGLLHPVSPRGKLMYAGVQAYDESVALLDAADTHLRRKPRDDGTADSRPLYQQTSLVRPCFRETDVVNWRKAAATNAAFVTMLADSAASTSPIPSPQPQATDASTGHEHDGNSAGSTGEGVEAALAYATVHGAYVVDSPRYLRALWALVNAQAAPSQDTTSPGATTASSPISTDGGSDGGAPCRVSYRQRQLSSPGDLRALAADHDVVVVATGAGSAPLWGPVNGEGPAEEGPLLPFALVRYVFVWRGRFKHVSHGGDFKF
jgi:glycine/D-amino acid oxidase-like deaminating enzyme